MVLFMLPFLFNPFGLAFSWLPFLYLSTWPLIVQTSGRESLMTHSVVLMLFVLTCDVTRRLMLKLIGFDLISLPAGLALLIALATDRGSALLSLIRPLFGGLLGFIEPLFLLLELYTFLGIIKNFNRWLSKLANIRDEESHDLSSWDPPLTRSSLTVRAFVILLTLLNYIGVYVIIQESKSFLGAHTGEDELPIPFNHAIAALVTLQLIAISLTIYKEDGILSESAMVALLASMPIFIASLSYYHAKQLHLSSSGSSWTSYFPFSFLFGSSTSQEELQRFDFDATSTTSEQQQQQQHLDFSDSTYGGSSSESVFFGDNVAGNNRGGGSLFGGGRRVDFRQVESSLLDGFLLDGQSKKLLSAPLKQLIMIINSILGLSVDKIAKYYFTPDFWYILLGRALCIACWTMGAQRMRSTSTTDVDFSAGRSQEQQQQQTSFIYFLRSLVNRTTVVKLLLILAYSQMLIQQIDNQTHLIQDLSAQQHQQQQLQNDLASPSGCCHSATASNIISDTNEAEGPGVANWFNCMWISAKACSSSEMNETAGFTRAKQLFILIVNSMIDSCIQILDSLVRLAMLALQKVASIHLLLHSMGAIWFARWRSPIIHRLLQSMLMQVSYIGNLLMSSTNSEDDDEFGGSY